MGGARPIRMTPMAIRPVKRGSAPRQPRKSRTHMTRITSSPAPTDAYATLTFTYDSGGNELTSVTSGPGTGQPSVTLTSTYNPQNNLASVTDNVSGNVGITTDQYDSGERLTTITTSYNGTAGPQIVTTYTANNQISAQSRTIGGSGTAVNTTYQYDSAERQTTITDYVSGGSALATYLYSYDNANRVTTMVDAEGTYTYTYDNGNELTSVYKSGTQVESYAYDANGNRTGTGYSTTVMNETATSPGVITYSYDSARQHDLRQQRWNLSPRTRMIIETA